MSNVPAPTRAEEGTEWFWRIVDADGLGDVPSDEVAALRLLCQRAARAAQAEAEVARLTAAIDMNAREVASVGLPDEAKWVLAAKDQWQRRAMAAEASASALRERVATLEAALRPFAAIKPSSFYSADGTEAEGYRTFLQEGSEREFTGADLARARTALEAPHADK